MADIGSAVFSSALDPRTLYGIGPQRAPEPGSARTPEAPTGPDSDQPGVVVHLSASARAGETGTSSAPLSEEQRKQVAELEKADQEVHQHEAAHTAAAGSSAGAASYGYTVGPDGKRYATSGEVSVDVTPVPNDPRATLRKMEQIARAALAPAKPSGADRAVAAQAQAAAAAARQEIGEAKNGATGDGSPIAGPEAADGPSSQPRSSRRVSPEPSVGAAGHESGEDGAADPAGTTATRSKNPALADYTRAPATPRGSLVSVAA
jgi:hypothetical protein